jgi:excisionase family DNA binding protein
MNEKTNDAGGEDRILLSVPEAARLVGISKTHAWEQVRRGDWPSLRIGKNVRVPRAFLEDLARGARPQRDQQGPDRNDHR